MESFKVDATESEQTAKFVWENTENQLPRSKKDSVFESTPHIDDSNSIIMENKKETAKTEEGKLIEWYIGDYLWAKMTGSSWWPCIVKLDPFLGIYTKILGMYC